MFSVTACSSSVSTNGTCKRGIRAHWEVRGTEIRLGGEGYLIVREMRFWRGRNNEDRLNTWRRQCP